MQETRHNCFGSKKCSTTLPQAKTGKHGCRNVTVKNASFWCAIVVLVSGIKTDEPVFISRRKSSSRSSEKEIIVFNNMLNYSEVVYSELTLITKKIKFSFILQEKENDKLFIYNEVKISILLV